MTEQELVHELNHVENERAMWKATAIKCGFEMVELKSQVNCLREELKMLNIGLSFSLCHGDGVIKRSDIKKLISDVDKALESTPEQCLAEVKAKAIEEAVKVVVIEFRKQVKNPTNKTADFIFDAILGAARYLREQAK